MADKITVKINNQVYHVEPEKLTGRALKALAAGDGVAADYELFLVHEPGTGNEPDQAVPDDKGLTLRNGMRFRAIPPGNRG